MNWRNIRSNILLLAAAWTPLISAEDSKWWDYGGSTVVHAGKGIRLTNQQPSQTGFAFSRVPLTATNWEIEIELKITGTGHLWGDGMAIWLTKDRGEVSGPVFGMKDKFEGLGIFIDTYKNNRPGVVFPYIMAMQGDGNTLYDKENDGKKNELGGCSARGLRNAEFPTKLRLTYFQDAELTVDVIYKQEDEWTRCFEVSNVKIPPTAYLGFTAETGELSDNHEIVRVDAKNLYSPAGKTGPASSGPLGSKDAKNKKAKQQKKERTKAKKSSGGGWVWVFLQILLLILVCVAAYVGFTVYRTQRRDRF